MRFTIKLEAKVECVDLVLRHGYLAALQAGRLTPSGKLSFHGIGLCEKTWEPVELSAAHELAGGGWRIA